MTEVKIDNLTAPRIEVGKAMKLAGLSKRFNCESSSAIPELWEDFGPHIGSIPGQVGSCAYGAKYEGDEDGYFTYMCAWEVSSMAKEVAALQYLEIPAQTYLVFTHSDHVSKIKQTCTTIWDNYLPQSKHKATKGIEFELYDEKFDPATGLGGLELWIPIRS